MTPPRPGARRALVEEGYDAVYGARPLKRAISRRLETPISRLIIAGEANAGDTVTVDVAAGAFTCAVAGR